MILRKTQQSYLEHYSNAQRLGDKPLTQNFVKKRTGETVKYYSSIDAEIYFENIYVDEVTDIAFSVEQQAMPLFGYNSYVFDDIAVGSRLVNGQFAINFTKAGYMYEVLDTMMAIKESQQKTTYISKRKPLWCNGFDIYVSYGNAKDQQALKGSSILVLKNVTLTSESQRFDYTGRPIQEVYTFVAQDIDFLNASEPVSDLAPIENQIVAVERKITAILGPVGNGHALIFTLPSDTLPIKLEIKDPLTGMWTTANKFDNNTAYVECSDETAEYIKQALEEDGETEVEVKYKATQKIDGVEIEINDDATVLATDL